MIISHGTATIIAGFQRSSSELGDSRRAANTCASISTTVTFAISAGCPIRTPPMASQLLVPAAVPAPVPITRVSASSSRLNAYAGTVSHWISRTEVRVTP